MPLTPWLPEGGTEGGGAAARGRECGGASLVLNKEGDDRKTIKNKKIVTKKERGSVRARVLLKIEGEEGEEGQRGRMGEMERVKGGYIASLSF